PPPRPFPPRRSSDLPCRDRLHGAGRSRPSAVGAGPGRGGGRRELAEVAEPRPRLRAVFAGTPDPRDAGSGAWHRGLRGAARGGRHLRSHAGCPDRARRCLARKRARDAGRARPGVGAAGRAAAQRADRRVPRHAARRSGGAGAAVRARAGTGHRAPERLLVAVTAAGPDSPSSSSRAARRRHGTGPASVLALLVLQLAGGSGPATASGGPREPEVVALDAEASRAVFHVRTRWGQRIAGRLPALGGERRVLADGRHQVRIALDAAGVELGGPGRLEEIARSDRFFDADAHPQIVFLSDPYP